MEKLYPIDYLALQINFARKAVELENSTLSDALFKYTSIRRMCNVSHSVGIEDPTIQEISKATVLSDPLKEIYQIYNNRKDIPFPKRPRIGSGCIQIEVPDDKGLFHIHLSINGSENHQIFSPNNMPKRKQEFGDAFRELLCKHGDLVKTGGGFSWLLGPLRASGIFPSEFHNSATPKVWYGSLALWGQFLGDGLQLKTYMVERFLENVARCCQPGELYGCFKYPVLEARVPVQAFVKHLG